MTYMKFGALIICYMVAICFSCTPGSDLDIERQRILVMHEAQRKHHFEKDTDAFVNQFSDQFISINNGVITRPSSAESLKMFGAYFSAVEFIKWDDVSDPIIELSDDGTMAYSIVDKFVVVAYPDTTGSVIKDTTKYAWSTIYRKYGNEWRIDCVTSTDQ